MKKLIPWFVFIFPVFSYAASIQLGTGGVTPHFAKEKKNYCNQWNNTGIIVNKSYYIRLSGENVGISVMQGEDSICSPISGLFLHYIFKKSDVADIGITVGGYEYNINNWKRHSEDTPSGIDAPSTLLAKVGEKNIVPVLALEVGLHLIKESNWSLKLNNLFTPIIFNHSLAYEYRF